MGLLTIRDNSLSSIRINGNYRVRLYRDINYGGGAYEEVNSSDPNLDIRSMGQQYSSIEITQIEGCDDERAKGVFLYSEQDFDGSCVHLRQSETDLGATAVGDNSASSVRINGDYKVTLFKDRNFGGASEETSKSDPNLDQRSLGEQYSSVRIEERVKCTDTSRPGVYVYDERRFKGNCHYLTGEASTLDDTPVGNDGPRSLRIVGPFKVTMWEDRDFSGRSDEFSKDQDDLTWRSLGDQYSSIRVQPRNEAPRVTINAANATPVTQINQVIWSNQTSWTFVGSAQDADGTVASMEMSCSGDSCNLARQSVTGTTNWSYVLDGIIGKNTVTFYAYDNENARSADSGRPRVTLYVDTAAPVTTPSLNGEVNPYNWATWFTTPVVVRLAAQDQGAGQARAGITEIRYQLDGGGWQTSQTADVQVNVGSDGQHRLEYYAIDKVGNQETLRAVDFAIDQTPPTLPANVRETHNVCTGAWQRDVNVPVFQWDPAQDATSGVWDYHFYFDTDPASVNYQALPADAPAEWTPFLAGIRTGTYYLRGRTRDYAGNLSAWGDFCAVRFDGAPPENPQGATHAAGVVNEQWQTLTSSADFTWPSAFDEGSGIQGYALYWGTDPAGMGTDFTTSTSHQGPALCDQGEACTGYLRLRSRDNVENDAEDWTTAYVLRYDTAPPTLDFSFNGGITTTTQTLVKLTLNAEDQGSGVREMRFSHDGINWTPWEVYNPTRTWQIPGISRQYWPVHVQVRDGVGLESAVVQHAVYLDVNQQRPRSNAFQLFDHTLSAGSERHTSQPSGYQGSSTVGQIVDAAALTSAHYSLVGGYQAGSQAIPLAQPERDDFNHVNGLLASSVISTTMQSGVYQMIAALGEAALPNNVTTLNSQNFRHQPGFLAAQPSTDKLAVVPDPEPGATPIPEPAPACAFAGVRINDDAEFTSNADVSLSICAPKAVEMRVSASDSFIDAPWEPYTEEKTWHLQTDGQSVLPRFVYVQFKDSDGTVQGSYFDDIILDPNPPSGEVLIGTSVNAAHMQAAQATGASSATVILGTGSTPIMVAAAMGADAPTIDMHLNARDDNSRISQMQISDSDEFSAVSWEPYEAVKPWTLNGEDGLKTVFVRYRDAAGNISEIAEASFILDRSAPSGDIFLYPQVAGPDASTINVYLAADDNMTGVSDYRISVTPDFVDADWQPYWGDILWPVDLAGEQSDRALHVQFRDFAGNQSPIYSGVFHIDNVPPDTYAEVSTSDAMTRTVTLYASDEQSIPQAMRLTNDLEDLEGAQWQPLQNQFEWAFDDDQTAWIQVADSVGNVTPPFAAYAAVEQPAPVAGFVSSGSEGALPVSVQFTDTSAGPVGVWLWDFGDGVQSGEQHPVHMYEVANQYTVTLTVRGPGGSDIYSATLDLGSEVAIPLRVDPLRQLNWSLISSNVQPSDSRIDRALTSIAGKFDRLIGEVGIFDANLDETFRSLTDLNAGDAYYLRTTHPGVTELRINGQRAAANTPIELHAGWNWIGYLPEIPLPTEYALQSIAGKVQRVLGLEQVFDANLPTFNDLLEMTPGQGYLIYMTEPATLIYPVDPPLEASGGAVMHTSSGLCSNVNPTPNTTLLYGRILINGQPAPAGVRVQALTPDGAIAGCALTHGDGAFGLMHVYGADGDDAAGLAAATPGFRHGEAIRLRVAGVEVPGAPAWQDDRTPHQVDVSIDALDFFKAYLPAIVRGTEVEVPAKAEGEAVEEVSVEVDDAAPVLDNAPDAQDSQSYLPMITPEHAPTPELPMPVPALQDGATTTQ